MILITKIKDIRTKSLFIIFLLVAVITFVHAFWADSVKVNLDMSSSNIDIGDFELPHDTTNTSFLVLDGGRNHSVAIDGEGYLWSWGQNDSYSRLGNGEITNNEKDAIPTKITDMGDNAFKAVSAGNRHNLAIHVDGSLWGWGYNTSNYGLLLSGTGTVSKPSPIVALQGSEFISVVAGESNSLVIDSQGRLWAWGSNANGQVGSGFSGGNYTVANEVMAGLGKEFVHVAAGRYHALAVDKTGNIFAWGQNNNYQLGLGYYNGTEYAPLEVPNATNAFFIKVAAGKEFSVALDNQGQIWGWGNNNYGQVGTGQSGNYTRIPTPIINTNGAFFTDISVDSLSDHVMALDEDNNVWIWGDNRQGQLGKGTNTNLSSPYTNTPPIPNAELENIEIIAIGAGAYHCMAIDASGRLWSWGGYDGVSGSNYYHLGFGSTVLASKNYPDLTGIVFSLKKE